MNIFETDDNCYDSYADNISHHNTDLLKHKDDLYYDKKDNKHTINSSNELSRLTINTTYLKIKTNKNVPSFFYNIRNFKNIFVCDFNNHDYFLLEDTIYSSCITS